MEAVGIDVGGTKIAALRLRADGTILARAERPTPARDPSATLEAIAATALELRTDGVVGIGIGICGLVASEPGVVRFSPNAAWRELAVGPFVGERTGLPWRVDNDATAAAYGEYRFGAGRGVRHLLLVTVGTGIGGGIVADGQAFRGAHGFAGEIG
ncbi:MAG: ROK family protein, partial [Actinomycetota bacterium]